MRYTKGDLAVRLIDFAAGVTLLRRRATGEARSDETIVLVADWPTDRG
ncbi:hypothetical protein [Actinokineospora diospyrosa]|uniref:Uncharacterized protein n=1 Tax=Actinokineospora diospyrosa TaxID=103728 RepID=A0ABT1I6A8_9PSEU|nr:hypothetical protein [Actinokineospora diospyrosa]MCP2268143.1 hypothetical protein [Actinokineospora diospyrosa]